MVFLTLADQLADQGIHLNTVNPGPVDTGGYLTEHMRDVVAPMPRTGRLVPGTVTACPRFCGGEAPGGVSARIAPAPRRSRTLIRGAVQTRLGGHIR